MGKRPFRRGTKESDKIPLLGEKDPDDEAEGNEAAGNPEQQAVAGPGPSTTANRRRSATSDWFDQLKKLRGRRGQPPAPIDTSPPLDGLLDIVQTPISDALTGNPVRFPRYYVPRGAGQAPGSDADSESDAESQSNADLESYAGLEPAGDGSEPAGETAHPVSNLDERFLAGSEPTEAELKRDKWKKIDRRIAGRLAGAGYETPEEEEDRPPAPDDAWCARSRRLGGEVPG